jgi:hypothetical protein
MDEEILFRKLNTTGVPLKNGDKLASHSTGAFKEFVERRDIIKQHESIFGPYIPSKSKAINNDEIPKIVLQYKISVKDH